MPAVGADDVLAFGITDIDVGPIEDEAGFIGAGENIRLTVTPTVAAATAGKITVRVLYSTLNRVNEIVSS